MPDASPAVRRLQEALRQLADQTRGRPLTGRTHQDADDTAGTVLTDDAVNFDPLPLLRALDLAGARVMVIGQVAGIMHGSRELTGDLDLLWDGDAVQARCLTVAFAGVGARLTDDDGVPVRCEPAAFRRPKVLFRTATASGDCCGPALPWGRLPVMDFIGRGEMASAGEFMIRYISRRDLISMRLAAGRVKDLRRVRELQALRLPPTETHHLALLTSQEADTSRPNPRAGINRPTAAYQRFSIAEVAVMRVPAAASVPVTPPATQPALQ